MIGGHKRRIEDFLSSAALIVVVLVAVIPVAWLLLTSFKNPVDVYAIPPKLIYHPTSDNYVTLLFERNFLHYLLNSTIVSLSTTLVCVFLGSLYSYTLARVRFRVRNNVAFWVLSLRMLPPIAVILPYYLIFRQLKLLDNPLALITVYIVMNFPLVVWIMKGFFEEIPIEMEESGKIDGCSDIQTFFRIVVPMVRPGLAGTAVITMIFSWNEFMFALILTGERAKTLPVGVTGFVTFEGIKWGLLASGGIFIIAPILILSFIFQKHLIRGLTLGSIK
jgi:multiple sugar transport system permease protein